MNVNENAPGDLSGGQAPVVEENGEKGVFVSEATMANINNVLTKVNERTLAEDKVKATETARNVNKQTVMELENGQDVYDHFLKNEIEKNPALLDSPERLKDFYNFGLQNPEVKNAIGKRMSAGAGATTPRRGTGTNAIQIEQSSPEKVGMDVPTTVEEALKTNSNLGIMVDVAEGRTVRKIKT